jgi:hypothetical protein
MSVQLVGESGSILHAKKKKKKKLNDSYTLFYHVSFTFFIMYPIKYIGVAN